MDHLTKLYYYKTIQLQEQYDKLLSIYTTLVEDISNMTDEQIERWVSQNSQNPEQAAAQREMLKNRREKARQAKAKPESKTETPKSEPKKEAGSKTGKKAEAPKTAPEPPPGRPPRSTEAGFDEYVKKESERMRAEAQAKQAYEARKNAADIAREKAAKEYAAKQKAAEQANPKPGAAKPKTTGTVVKPSKVSSPVGVKAAEIGKSVGRGLGSFGAGWLGYDIGRAAGQKAAEMAGIENETAKEVAGEVAGGAAGGVAATTASSLMGKALPTLGNLAKAAGTGALVSGVAYGALKVGEKIGTEIGETEIGDGRVYSDVMGKDIYDKYLKLTGRASSDEQLNTKKTGVAGGVPAINQQIAAEEQAEEEAKTRKATEKEARIQQKLQRLKDEAAKQGS